MARLTVLVTFLCTFYVGWAQVVRTNPVFPSADQEITFIFDAAQGNQGLKDCFCDVYFHIGVITNKSTSSTDWRYVPTTWGQINPAWRLQPLGPPNQYQFKLTPNTFFNVPGDETIESVAMVFRNSDGSRAGRAIDGSDIFVKLYSATDGLLTLLQQPEGNVTVTDPTIVISILVQSSQPSIFSVSDNGALVYETPDSTKTLSYDLNTDPNGIVHQVEIEVRAARASQTLGFQYYNVKPSPVQNPPFYTEPGMVALPNGSYRLKLFAPGKKSAFILCDANHWTPAQGYEMFQSEDGTYFWQDINVDPGTQWFNYQYLVDGALRVADPYSTIILDPFNDNFIGDPYFPEYPDGQTSELVTAYKIGGHPFNWTDDNFTVEDKTALNIYECWLHDFLRSHRFSDLKDTLGYLKRLGFNALELMPVSEFGGNISWGYNPEFHMALDKFYGNPIEFKELVNTAHEMGIAIILDVVHNQVSGQSPLTRLYWDENLNRPSSDNPWLNPVATHPFNVFNDFNHESPYTKAYTIQSLRHWLEEYHIDGFRFDLSKGFTQKNTGSDVGAWSAYDQSRINILKNYADSLWLTKPDATFILEHLGDNSEEKVLADYGFMLWGNINHNFNEATMGFTSGGGSDLSGCLYNLRSWNEPHLVAYMESHDEERLMYKNQQFGNESGFYSTRDLETALDRLKQANTFYWLFPGPKMIWQFGELGYDFSINRCSNGTISNDCRLTPKPIRWEYYDDPLRRSVYDHISKLTRLRATYQLHAPDRTKQLLGPAVKKFETRKDGLVLYAIGNFDVVEQTERLDFSSQGTWYELFTGQDIQFSGGVLNATLAPGEYRLYANQPINILSSTSDPEKEVNSMQIFPNPASRQIFLETSGPLDAEDVEILDLSGKSILLLKNPSPSIDISSLKSGMYFLKARTRQGTEILKFIKS